MRAWPHEFDPRARTLPAAKTTCMEQHDQDQEAIQPFLPAVGLLDRRFATRGVMLPVHLPEPHDDEEVVSDATHSNPGDHKHPRSQIRLLAVGL
eukprot:scaffold58158_cov61-Phaeocystis_antarctica.AAC.3